MQTRVTQRLAALEAQHHLANAAADLLRLPPDERPTFVRLWKADPTTLATDDVIHGLRLFGSAVTLPDGRTLPAIGHRPDSTPAPAYTLTEIEQALRSLDAP